MIADESNSLLGRGTGPENSGDATILEGSNIGFGYDSTPDHEYVIDLGYA